MANKFNALLDASRAGLPWRRDGEVTPTVVICEDERIPVGAIVQRRETGVPEMMQRVPVPLARPILPPRPALPNWLLERNEQNCQRKQDLATALADCIDA